MLFSGLSFYFRSMKNLSSFLLNPDVIYLNHGSFGACAKPIFEDYQKWQLKLEADSVQFMTKIGVAGLKASREKMGEFISCKADELVFVPNPTFAVNILAKNLKLNPGDEVLTTDLEYGALDRTWKYYCEKQGANYKEVPIDLPLNSHREIIDKMVSAMSDKTKILFISEITSTTALKLPVYEICEAAKNRGITTIVDGAHSPAHIPIDLQKLKADFYTGACHKWMLTPKGSSFLFARKEYQDLLDPLVISWGYDAAYPSDSQFLDYHEYNGTRDYSAFLTIPAAIDYLEKNNWQQVAHECNEVILKQYPRFCELLQTEPLCPLSKDYLGYMCSIPVKTNNPLGLKECLFGEHRIEIPVMEHKGKVYLRISFQQYNTIEDLDALYTALEKIIQEGKYIQL